jgi:hypothetical protein
MVRAAPAISAAIEASANRRDGHRVVDAATSRADPAIRPVKGQEALAATLVIVEPPAELCDLYVEDYTL